MVVMLRPRLIFYLFFLKKKKKTKNAHRLRRPSAPFITRAGYIILYTYIRARIHIGSLQYKRIKRSVAYGNGDNSGGNNSNNNTNNNNNNNVYTKLNGGWVYIIIWTFTVYRAADRCVCVCVCRNGQSGKSHFRRRRRRPRSILMCTLVRVPI
jgi:hypothetical protein